MSLTSENGAPMMTMPVMPANSNGNDNGWGNGNDWWGILLLIALMGGGFGGFGGWGGMGGMMGMLPLMYMWPFMFGGFGGGFGNGSIQPALTRGELCQDMNFQDVKNGVAANGNAINQGFANLNSTICHQQYDTAQMINGVTAAVNGGFQALNGTICQQQYDTAQQLNAMNIANMQNANAANVVALQNANALQSQLANCCCENREGQAAINYNLSTQSCDTRNTIQNTTRDIIDSQNNGFRAILDKLCQQEIAAKDAQIAAQNQRIFGLELAASQANQNQYLVSTLRPTPVPAYPASSPCGLGNWAPQVLANGYGLNGYNNGCCGCNG